MEPPEEAIAPPDGDPRDLAELPPCASLAKAGQEETARLGQGQDPWVPHGGCLSASDVPSKFDPI